MVSCSTDTDIKQGRPRHPRETPRNMGFSKLFVATACLPPAPKRRNGQADKREAEASLALEMACLLPKIQRFLSPSLLSLKPFLFPLFFLSFFAGDLSPQSAAAKSLQSCLTLCDPIDSSPPGSSVPGILQARTLQWVATSFSNA